MKQPTEQDLKVIYWWLIDNPQYIYSKFVNLRPVEPPYSKILRPHRFYLRTRRWRRDRMSSMIISIKNDDCTQQPEYQRKYTWEQFNRDFFGRFTDVTTLTETIDWEQRIFEYWMWISQDKLTLRIFKSEDWCTLNEIIKDCFCACWAEYFIPINFLKWKPRNLYANQDWITLSIDWTKYDWRCWVQKNYTYYQKRNSLADLWDSDVDWINTKWNYLWGDESINPWDYVYTYSVNWSCSSNRSWICWQINTVTGVSQDNPSRLMVSNYWNWFEPWQIDPVKRAEVNQYYSLYWSIDWLATSYYVAWREPQIEWYNMNYMIFPEYWETFAYQNCTWIVAYHYHHYNDYCNTAVTTPFCNFEWCFWDWIMYTGRNWVSHAVYLNNTNSVILYSDWGNLWYLWAWNTVWVRKNTLWMTSFQNYIVYFGKQHIWAFYIDSEADKLTWTNRYVAKWNIIRNNLWFWVNPNWRVDAYDEYDNSFYFLWSNKRIYALSIVPSNEWVLVSKLDDMTDDERCKRIIWDLENIDNSDYVYIQADDDRFRVFINSSSTNNWVADKTKLLTYWKRYKFWTTDISCSVVVSKEKEWICWKYFIWDNLYDECWNFDYKSSPVEYMVEAYIWEDEIKKDWWDHSFNLKYLDYIKTQIGKPSKKLLWDSRLEITWYKNWIQFKKIINWLFDNEYLKVIDDINNWLQAKPTQCMIDNLNDCEWFFEDCKWDTTIQYDVELWSQIPDNNWLVKYCNWYNHKQCFNSCACPKEKKIDDHCFCYDDKKYHIAPFANLLSMIQMKAEMYTVQLRWNDDIRFWWFFIWVYSWNSPKEVMDCNKRNCIDCKKDINTYDKSQRCF